MYEGYYDPPIVFFTKISSEFFNETNLTSDQKVDFLQTVSSIKMDDELMNFLMNISSMTDLSPKGFNSLLSFIHDSIFNEQKEYMQKIFKNCMKLLCSMIRDNQLLSVQEWPVNCGGGVKATQDLILFVLKIFNIPFNNTNYDNYVDEISVGLAKADIIYLCLNSLKYIEESDIPIGI